ncbi:MAG: mtnN 2 [Micavibrio sp.]|nr:mtnN 2 [Micavibrio sp.]
MQTRPLLIFAMEQESQDLFPGYDVLHSGIGKINAAYALTTRLAQAAPGLVINLGTAGSRRHKGGTIVNCTRFVQRDMNVTPLGFEKWQTPFSDDPVTIAHGLAIEGVMQGICGTGDSFDISAEATHFDVVDMEAYALALICQRRSIPFLCLKYISDGANDDAHTDFTGTLRHAAGELLSALKKSNY